MYLKKLNLSALMLFVFILPMQAQDYSRKSVAVTVYNANRGVIKDVRSMDLKKGLSEIEVRDVAQNIDPTSVHIKFNGEVLEQNYQYDLASLDAILQKYIDKNIQLVGEKNELIEGKLISTQGGGLVLQKKEGGLIMITNTSKYLFNVDALPEGLITKPTLVWKLNSQAAGSQDVEISYLTGGMNWHAEYVALLNEKDTKIGLNSWVSIENQSGASFDNAELKLVAGDVNLVRQAPAMRDGVMMKNQAFVQNEAQFQENQFFEYHIYNLQHPTDLKNNETKQISLFQADDINVTKKYLYRNWSNFYNQADVQKVAVIIEFDNKANNHLGMPMPKGRVRLYKSDGKTNEFIGEDMIDHTPKDEKIKLKIGNAFDLVAEEIQTDNKRITDKVYDQSFKITLKNRKDEDVVIEVDRNMGLNWEIRDSNLKFEKKDAQHIIFQVPVKNNSETVLEYTVRYNY